VSRSTTLARVISAVVHPLFLPTVVLLLVAYAKSGSLRDFLFRVLIILFFLVVLPVIYIYLKSPRAASGAKRIQDPVAFFRKHPKEICLVGIICVLPCILLLVFLDAPSPLVATLVALLATGITLALVNMFYRASYHLAATTTLVIAVVIIWGLAVLPVLAAIPLVGWALYSLRRHSPGQLATGFSLALIISTASFYGFGLLGNIQ
jgi:hypothetical protein